MLKQNIPGFYGVGTALKASKETRKWQEVKNLYKQSQFFKTVIDNCMMSMSKADCRLIAYLEKGAALRLCGIVNTAGNSARQEEKLI